MPDSATDPVQSWLDDRRGGKNPSIDDFCQLCEDRVRLLVQPRLRRFPIVRAESQTTDIVDETLFRLIRALPDVSPMSVLDLTKFLATIIRRILLERLRTAQRQKRLQNGSPARRLSTDDDSDHPVDTDSMVAFHEYVEALPAEERMLFDLLYYRGLTTAEAATILGRPLSTLKRQWAKARYRAGRILDGDFKKN